MSTVFYSMKHKTSSKGCEIIDSIQHIKNLESYKCHLLLTYEDLKELEQDSQNIWTYYCYTSRFNYLFALIFLARVLKKQLHVYVDQIDKLKLTLYNSRINLKGISFRF